MDEYKENFLYDVDIFNPISDFQTILASDTSNDAENPLLTAAISDIIVEVQNLLQQMDDHYSKSLKYEFLHDIQQLYETIRYHYKFFDFSSLFSEHFLPSKLLQYLNVDSEPGILIDTICQIKFIFSLHHMVTQPFLSLFYENGLNPKLKELIQTFVQIQTDNDFGFQILSLVFSSIYPIQDNFLNSSLYNIESAHFWLDYFTPDIINNVLFQNFKSVNCQKEIFNIINLFLRPPINLLWEHYSEEDANKWLSNFIDISLDFLSSMNVEKEILNDEVINAFILCIGFLPPELNGNLIIPKMLNHKPYFQKIVGFLSQIGIDPAKDIELKTKITTYLCCFGQMCEQITDISTVPFQNLINLTMSKVSEIVILSFFVLGNLVENNPEQVLPILEEFHVFDLLLSHINNDINSVNYYNIKDNNINNNNINNNINIDVKKEFFIFFATTAIAGNSEWRLKILQTNVPYLLADSISINYDGGSNQWSLIIILKALIVLINEVKNSQDIENTQKFLDECDIDLDELENIINTAENDERLLDAAHILYDLIKSISQQTDV